MSQNGTTQTLDLDPNLRMSTKAKVTGGNTTNESYAYVDDSDSPAWIQTGASTWQRFIGGIDRAAGVQDNTGSAKYHFVNLRGDVVATGFPDPVESAEIDEFGVPKTDLPADRRYGFHGSKQREALTSQGMVAMGVRLYAPRTGRFLQVDPVLGGTANPYEYPSDPINQSDLNGMWGGLRSLTSWHKNLKRKLRKVFYWVSNTVCSYRATRTTYKNIRHYVKGTGYVVRRVPISIVYCAAYVTYRTRRFYMKPV
ncbi:MAG: RHS repeat-associated core domain-containing protein [Solirubrobacterales bacterium]